MAKMNTKKTEVIQPEGNYYDKYHSTNPIVKWMMKGFMNSIRELFRGYRDKISAGMRNRMRRR